MNASGPAAALPADSIAADFFDGRTSRAHAVRVRVAGDQVLISGGGVARAVPVADVTWPEAGTAGARTAPLRGGGALHCEDGVAWDAWAHGSGLQQGLVSKVQRSWAWTLVACGVLAVVLAGGYLWGVPLAVRSALAFTPASVDRSLGELALRSIGDSTLAPSQLPPEQQQRLRAAFERAVRNAYPEGERPAYELHFHAGKDKRLGPNAFALPGGAMVMTDELVKLVGGDEAVLVGVLGHELGHVRHRHGMQALGRSTVLLLATSAALGDFSNLVAALPALLGQLAYSRDFEREADREAVVLLRAAGHSPAVMVTFFEKIGEVRRAGPASAASAPAGAGSEPSGRQPGRADPEFTGGAPPIAFSSHPADDERIRFFREAAAQR